MNLSKDPRWSTLEALHDSAVFEAAQQLLSRPAKVVATMRDHCMGVHRPTRISLTSPMPSHEGYLVASGGGPGGMEASHLGAAFANLGLLAFDEATGKLNTASLTDHAKSGWIL